MSGFCGYHIRYQQAGDDEDWVQILVTVSDVYLSMLDLWRVMPMRSSELLTTCYSLHMRYMSTEFEWKEQLLQTVSLADGLPQFKTV